MTAPLRRRVRAKALTAVVRAGALVPTAAALPALRAASRLATGRRFAATIDANVAAAAPWVAARAPEVAARLAGGRAFHRDVADHVALQTSHWLRLARGAGPGERRGAWVDDLVRLDGTCERLDRALARGRGAIVVTAHIGDWELLCARLRRLGHHGAVVGRVRGNDPSHAWLVRMRRAYGTDTLPQDAPPRSMLRVLRGGGILGLLTDLRARRVDARPVPLMGVTVPTMTAAAAFTRASGASVVPMRCTRDPDGAFTLRADEPLTLDPARPRREAEDALLTAQNDAFGRWILDAPEQWAWHQERLAAPAR